MASDVTGAAQLTHMSPGPKAPEGVGVASGVPDLWCTYAAIRTLCWLDRTSEVADPEATAAYLNGRRNADGGYAWSRGMASDAWATFYCAQALKDMGRPVPQLDATGSWLRDTWSGDAYAMMPGQSPDVWATHFSSRTAVEVCHTEIPDGRSLEAWLAALQSTDGGLSWTPEEAKRGRTDVRACYYGIKAWAAAASIGQIPAPPWDVETLVSWLRDRQAHDGGFGFSPEADVSCMWATYRATGALEALGRAPRDTAGCAQWVMSRRGSSGAFVRWEGYDVEDVWASFCAVGTLKAVGEPLEPVSEAVAKRIEELACSGGGYTYRDAPKAADALSTAAAALAFGSQKAPDRAPLVQWLEGCQLPNEGGVMYMPGRGSEVRCTLWALAAGAFDGNAPSLQRITEWLASLQNADGGFGYWEGRGSDMVSTAAALEIFSLLGNPPDRAIDTEGVAAFLVSCSSIDGSGSSNVPGATSTLRAGLQAHRAHQILGRGDIQDPSDLLRAHRVRGGGFANEGRRMPDLLSTYEAVLTIDRFRLSFEADHVGAFLERVRAVEGTAWTPLAPAGDDPLADCLGLLLEGRLRDPQLRMPALALS